MIAYKMLLLRAPNVNNSHILVGKQFNFLRNILDQTWKSFKAKFELQ